MIAEVIAKAMMYAMVITTKFLTSSDIYIPSIHGYEATQIGTAQSGWCIETSYKPDFFDISRRFQSFQCAKN